MESILVRIPPEERIDYCRAFSKKEGFMDLTSLQDPYWDIYPDAIISIREAKGRKIHYLPKGRLPELVLIPFEALVPYIKEITRGK